MCTNGCHLTTVSFYCISGIKTKTNTYSLSQKYNNTIKDNG